MLGRRRWQAWTSAALLATVGTTGAASALKPPAASTVGATPYTEAIFNDPASPALATAIEPFERNLIRRTADPDLTSMPVTIRANFFHITDVRLAKELLDAADRPGVNVQVLLDGSNRTLGCHGQDGCVNPAYKSLAEINYTSTPSSDWMRACNGTDKDHIAGVLYGGNGCIGADRDHNKFILLSHTGYFAFPANDLVFQTSANSTPRTRNTAFNNAIIFANQLPIYNDYVEYFNYMASRYAATTQPSIRRFQSHFAYHPDTTTLSRHKIATWSFPRRPDDDPVATTLSNVATAKHCANRQTDKSGLPRTEIAFAMSQITGRSQVIDQLARLRRHGCVVNVVYANIGPRDRRELTAVGARLYRLCLNDTDQPDQSPLYLHSKYILIDGTVHGLGSDRRIVYTGSSNFDDGTLTGSDDRIVRYVEPAGDSPTFNDYVDDYRNQLDAINRYPQSPRNCLAND